MTISVTRLPDEIGVGALVSFNPDVAKNTGEGGVSGRKAMRPPLRNYMVNISPEISDEIQAIVMATYVQRYPLGFRDPINYKFTSEPAIVAADGLTAEIGKTWAPATGDLTLFERILIIDESEVPLTFTIDGLPPTSGTWSLGDYGILHFTPPIDPAAVVLVSGQLLKAVCILDAPSAAAVGRSSTDVQYQFTSMRLEEIFEAEFRRLTAT